MLTPDPDEQLHDRVEQHADGRSVLREQLTQHHGSGNTDIWPEPWCLPFTIEQLGDLSRQISGLEARERWPVVADRWGSKGGVSAAMNLTGTTVFVPVPITARDWQLICDDLATNA